MGWRGRGSPRVHGLRVNFTWLFCFLLLPDTFQIFHDRLNVCKRNLEFTLQRKYFVCTGQRESQLAILYVNRANHNVISETLNEGQNS